MGAARSSFGLTKHDLKFKRHRLRMEIERHRSHQIGLCGNYTTGNLGDHAIGKALYLSLTRNGYDVQRFHKDIGPTKSDITILGGGGVIHDHQPKALQSRLSFLNDTSLIIGVGYQHVASEESREMLCEVLNNSKIVTVRDHRSKRKLEELCDCDVELTACPAFLLNPPKTGMTNGTGVNFRPWLGIGAYGDSEKLSKYFQYDTNLDIPTAGEQYLENIHTICDRVDHPVYIPLDPSDEKFARKYLDIPVLKYKPSVETALERVAGVDRMVSTRYHSNVFSILCNKPMFSIAYAPKVQELADRVDVPSIRPHEETFDLKFERPNQQKREKLLLKSKKNIELIQKTVHSYK